MLTSLAKKISNLIALERGLSRATQVLAPCPPSGALNSQMLTPPQNIKVFINKNRSNRWFPARVCVGVLLLFPGPRLNSHKSVPRSYPLQYERFSPNQQRAQPQKKNSNLIASNKISNLIAKKWNHQNEDLRPARTHYEDISSFGESPARKKNGNPK